MKYKLPGYILFFMACMVFSFYWQFPGQTLSRYIEKKVSKNAFGMAIEINGLAPSLPWGLKAESINMTRQDDPVLQLGRAFCMLDMRSVFSENRRVNYKASLLNGLVSGTAAINDMSFDNILLESRLENLQVENLDMGATLAHCRISGVLNGRIDGVLNNGTFTVKQGDITASNLAMVFSTPIYAIEQFSFSLAEVRFDMPDHQEIRLETFKMKGRQLDITASGDIAIARKPEQSRLDMKTRIVLYPLFFMNAGEALPVDVTRDASDNAVFHLQIAGTFEEPLVTIDKDEK